MTEKHVPLRVGSRLGGLAQIGVQVSEVIGVSERRENRQHSFRGVNLLHLCVRRVRSAALLCSAGSSDDVSDFQLQFNSEAFVTFG